MNVVASFKLNKNLEKAIAELEYYGIDRGNILALPLLTMADRQLHIPNNKILFENAPIIGTILMLLGTIYGFILRWGPIFWGLIGLIVGMISGIIIDLYRVKRKKDKQQNDEDGKLTEVFLLVHCSNKEQALFVKEKLWQHLPNGVSTFFVDARGDEG